MEDALEAVAEADALAHAASQSDDIPAAQEAHSQATYVLLRQLVLEIAGLREDLRAAKGA